MNWMLAFTAGFVGGFVLAHFLTGHLIRMRIQQGGKELADAVKNLMGFIEKVEK